jgi:hypothetical protein
MKSVVKIVTFKVAEVDLTLFQAGQAKSGMSSFSRFIRLALRTYCEQNGVQGPITKTLSAKEAAAFPLTSWKRKKSTKKPVEVKKKIAKGVAR